jgi:hypothetical protein
MLCQIDPTRPGSDLVPINGYAGVSSKEHFLASLLYSFVDFSLFYGCGHLGYRHQCACDLVQQLI